MNNNPELENQLQISKQSQNTTRPIGSIYNRIGLHRSYTYLIHRTSRLSSNKDEDLRCFVAKCNENAATMSEITKSPVVGLLLSIPSIASFHETVH